MKAVSTFGTITALSCALIFSACGGSAPPTPPPVPPNPPPPIEGESGEGDMMMDEEDEPAETPTEAAKPAAQATWGSMSHEQKLEHMKTAVVPKMSGLFQSVNAKRYKDMNCVSCHGPGAKNGKFGMPNAKLPKLTTDGSFKREMKKSPAMTKFMMAKVVPEMAGLLSAEPYSAKTKKGFGCFGCHTAAK